MSIKSADDPGTSDELCHRSPLMADNILPFLRPHRGDPEPRRMALASIGFQWRAYAQSKLANVLFTYELARRLDGTNVTANTLHPGFVATNFGRNNRGLAGLMFRALQVAAISPEQGAETMIYLATSPEVQGVTGQYFVKRRAVRSSNASDDVHAAQRLWQLSAELVRL
jgi:NAD(P)-dependent dehydrogenase (short-subunit alcohol dehydrogenase family)